jgi:uncharacterized membrane protein YccC
VKLFARSHIVETIMKLLVVASVALALVSWSVAANKDAADDHTQRFDPYDHATVAPQQHAFHDGPPHELQDELDALKLAIKSFYEDVASIENRFHDAGETRGAELERLAKRKAELTNEFERLCEKNVKQTAHRLDEETHKLRQTVEKSSLLMHHQGKTNHHRQHERAHNMHVEKLQAAEEQWARIGFLRHQCQHVDDELKHAAMRQEIMLSDHKADSVRDL